MSQITTEREEAEAVQSFPVRLPESLHRKFKAKCANDGRTMHDVITEAVRNFIASEGK